MHTLTHADRCDTGECGAQALVKVKKSGYDLIFCAHHYHKVQHPLSAQSFKVVEDRRETLHARATEVHA